MAHQRSGRTSPRGTTTRYVRHSTVAPDYHHQDYYSGPPVYYPPVYYPQTYDVQGYHTPTMSYPAQVSGSDLYFRCPHCQQMSPYQPPQLPPVQGAYTVAPAAPAHISTPVHVSTPFVEAIPGTEERRGTMYESPQPTVRTRAADPYREPVVFIDRK